jgi:hypothetical protein
MYLTVHLIQGNKKVSVHLMIRYKNTQKYFKQFESLTMITQLELEITEGVSVGLVSINVWRLAGDTLNITCNFLYCNHEGHRDFLSPCRKYKACAKQKVYSEQDVAGSVEI